MSSGNEIKSTGSDRGKKEIGLCSRNLFIKRSQQPVECSGAKQSLSMWLYHASSINQIRVQNT